MKELLFDNIVEKEALENLLALNQIKKCDEEINKYTNEINEQTEKMIEILKDEEIDESYVEKIYKYKSILNNLDGDSGRIQELETIIEENENRINEFQDRINEIEEKLEELKKEIFETDDPSKVIECQNEIESSNVRLNDLNDILNGLISDNTPLLIEKEYLIAKNNDFDFNIPNYNKKEITSDLDEITKEFNEKVEALDLPIRENIEFCQKKIKNRELEIDKLLERKNNVIENYPNSVSLDVEKAYNDLSNVLCDLELSRSKIEVPEANIFDEEVVEEEIVAEEEIETPIVKEEKEIKEGLSSLDEEVEEVTIEEPVEATVVPEETTEEVVEEETVADEEVTEPEVVETTKEENKEEEIGSVSYVLSDGESMMNIAEKVYPSKDNWEAIYYFNKDAIDNFLVSNGLSNDFETIKELANDTTLFTGIQLEIPTDYNYKI